MFLIPMEIIAHHLHAIPIEKANRKTLLDLILK
jgi:hypothetical protein